MRDLRIVEKGNKQHACVEQSGTTTDHLTDVSNQ